MIFFYGNVCSLKKKKLWRRREVAIISLQIILYIFTRRDYFAKISFFIIISFFFFCFFPLLLQFRHSKKRRQCSQQLSERHSSLLIWKLFKQNWEILMFLKCSYIYVQCTYVNIYFPWCATHIIQRTTILPQTLDFDFPNKFPWEEFERNKKRKTFHNNILDWMMFSLAPQTLKPMSQSHHS